MTNDFVSLLKDSSLVSTIAVIELTKRMQIAGVDLRDYLVPGLVCAAMYMILSFPLAELARRLERRLARDQRPFAL
jgi:polar amino acid transport system substrate-binding protein